MRTRTRGRLIRRVGKNWTVEDLPSGPVRVMDSQVAARMAQHWPSFGATIPGDSEPARRGPIERPPTTDPAGHNSAMRTRARNARAARRGGRR